MVNTRPSLSISAFRVWTVSIGRSAQELDEGEDEGEEDEEDEEGNKGNVGRELRFLAVGYSGDMKSSESSALMFRDPGEEMGLLKPGEIRLGTHSDSAV